MFFSLFESYSSSNTESRAFTTFWSLYHSQLGIFDVSGSLLSDSLLPYESRETLILGVGIMEKGELHLQKAFCFSPAAEGDKSNLLYPTNPERDNFVKSLAAAASGYSDDFGRHDKMAVQPSSTSAGIG